MIFQVSLVILWGLILLLIIVFYTELCRLKPFSPHSSCHTVSSPQKHSSHQTNARFAGTVRSGLGASYKVIEHDDGFSSSQPVSIPASAISSDCSQETPEPQLARSSQMIEEVEKYIQKMAEQSYTSASARKPLGIDYCSSENGEQQLSSELSEETSGRLSESFSDNPEWSSALALGRGADVAGDVSLMSSGTTDQGSYIQRYGALPYNLQGQESVFYILYQGGSVSSILRQWVCLLHPVSMGLSSRSCIGGSVFYILHWWVCRPLRYQWVCLPHPVSVGLSPPSCIIGSVSPILYQWVCLLCPVSVGLSPPSCTSGSVSPLLYQWVCLPRPVSVGLSPPPCISGSVSPTLYQWVCLPHPVSVGLSPLSCTSGSVSPILYQWVRLPHPVTVGLSPQSCTSGSVSTILYQWV